MSSQEPTPPAGLVLGDDRHCFGCGERNPIGLGLTFTLQPDGEVQTQFTPDKRHQGYTDLLHGGLMSLVLDEAMVNAAWLNRMPAVSVDIRVRLRHAVRLGEKLQVAARVTGTQKRLILTRAEAVDGRGRVVAEAEAKCLRSAFSENDSSGPDGPAQSG